MEMTNGKSVERDPTPNILEVLRIAEEPILVRSLLDKLREEGLADERQNRMAIYMLIKKGKVDFTPKRTLRINTGQQ